MSVTTPTTTMHEHGVPDAAAPHLRQADRAATAVGFVAQMRLSLTDLRERTR